MKERLVLFLGSGFSAELGLPVTSRLQDQLLSPIGTAPEVVRREEFITQVIRDFWRAVYGWTDKRPMPSLEDHFTNIDLAANSGHFLGRKYGPKKLRALRRFTIHRVFKLLDVRPDISPNVELLFRRLTDRFQISIVTTNWDIIVERCLQAIGEEYFYSGTTLDPRGEVVTRSGSAIYKLHGSGNWGYCDLCQGLLTSPLDMGKTAVHFHWLLEPDDFRLFEGGGEIADELDPEFKQCFSCHGRIGTRVATFSYRKHLAVPVYQTIWDQARSDLCFARRWLFVGYSMPEADIEIRHLLKTAEHARKDPNSLLVDVVVKDKAAGRRYQRFFGTRTRNVADGGLSKWIDKRLGKYCR